MTASPARTTAAYKAYYFQNPPKNTRIKLEVAAKGYKSKIQFVTIPQDQLVTLVHFALKKR